jgi:hypothetical protein
MTHIYNSMSVSKPFKHFSNNPVICNKVIGMKIQYKVIWLLNRTSAYKITIKHDN